MMNRLDYIFKPNSIAIIGASDNRQKIGFRYVSHIKEGGYRGKIYPINPKGGEILGLKVYPNLDSIEEEVDSVVVLTGAVTVPQVMKDCVRKGVKGAILVTAGFSEIGEEGKRLEAEVLKILRSGGMRAVGPNCLGIANLEIGLNATAIPFLPKEKGPMGIISQSGSTLELIFSWTWERGIYLNKVVSTGNEADLKLTDYFEYFSNDPEIKVIMLYIEGIDEQEGRRFIKLANETTPRKPVVALKAGRTSAGRKAIETHTGAMGGRSEIYSTVFYQCGIIEARSYEELFDFGLAFSAGRIPKGDRVAIMGPGGPGINTADACEEAGIHVTEFSPQTTKKIKEMLPDFVATVKNPLDMTISSSMEQRERVYEALLEDEYYDGAIFLSPAIFHMKRFSEIIPRLYANSSRPLLIGSIISLVLPEMWEGARAFGKAGIPFYPSPERAARAYSALVKYGKYLRSLKN